MTQSIVDIQPKVLVAIDISKERHDVLLELPDGRRKGFRISNHKADFDRFAAYLSGLELPCHIAFRSHWRLPSHTGELPSYPRVQASPGIIDRNRQDPGSAL
jgi:hypothetical protein